MAIFEYEEQIDSNGTFWSVFFEVEEKETMVATELTKAFSSKEEDFFVFTEIETSKDSDDFLANKVSAEVNHDKLKAVLNHLKNGDKEHACCLMRNLALFK